MTLTPAQIEQLASIDYEYINDEDALADLCADYASAKVLSIDTEFVRTRTLKPQLGLIQVFDRKRLALIDPIAIKDLSAFTDLLSNTQIVKVLHSCSEDIEALYHNLGVVPDPLIDTQFAASILGKGASVGYANLVESLFSIALDKGESRTDWLARPLSTKQLDYAAKDVTYLLAAFDELYEELETRSLTDVVISESALLIEKKQAAFPAQFAYLNLANNWKLNARSLYALKLLAQWRLETAREKDMAINFVVKEQAMLDIAIKLPSTSAQLHQMHALFGKQIRLYCDDILSLVEQAQNASEADFIAKPQRLIEFSHYKRALAEIKALVEQVGEKHDIPPAVIASKKQIGQLLKWCWFELDDTELQGLKPDLIHGWRRDLLLEHLLPMFTVLEPSTLSAQAMQSFKQGKYQAQEGKYYALRSL